MICINLIKKAIIYGSISAFIFLLSSRFVLACQSVICDNGVESNLCAIELTEATLQKYLYLCFALLTSTLFFYFLSRKGLGIVVVVFFSFIAHPGWFSKKNAGNHCDNSAVNEAFLLSIVSFGCFACQFVFWLVNKKSLNKQMP